MKRYITPEIDYIFYDVKDCLEGSSEVVFNMEDNVIINNPSAWEDLF